MDMLWLAVAGYLLIGLGELIPTRFRTDQQGAAATLAVCLFAVRYALCWPARLAALLRGT